MDDRFASQIALASEVNALRTRLTIAIGRLQLIRRGLAGESAAASLDRRLATIEGELFHLSRIADRIEDLS